ncbi:hypothetical protein J7J69_03175, partial [candidate division WOR-3 bacterium]|nr:hypothetical protein [candidate division WOR-3 bacterium]
KSNMAFTLFSGVIRCNSPEPCLKENLSVQIPVITGVSCFFILLLLQDTRSKVIIIPVNHIRVDIA